jgi:hypothetical protein
MKRIGIMVISLAFLAMGCTSGEATVGDRTTMKVAPVVDLGKVALGEVVNAKFTVENTGDKPLIMGEVKGTCGCTVADWTKESIAPGEKGFVKAQINTAGFSYGPATKGVNIVANTDPAITPLHVKLNVIK